MTALVVIGVLWVLCLTGVVACAVMAPEIPEASDLDGFPMDEDGSR